MIKYIIMPGFVKSKNDGETHYISASKLIHLYGVNPKECYIVRDGEMESIPKSVSKTAKVLSPKYNGDYSLD